MIMNNTCVAFGTFEFIHKGHRKIAETVVKVAKERKLTPVVVCVEKEGKIFTTDEEKEYLLKKMGVEMVLFFSEIEAREVVQILAANVVVMGEEDSELEAVKELVEVIEVPYVKVNGEIVSTALVEEAFEVSDYERIQELCGHPYMMIGEVVHGKKLGRTENMPTANIEVPHNKRKPKHAVYGARIRLGEELLDAVVNIGRRPTVDDFEYTTIEALILDFEREIYGEKLVLEIHKYIRGIQKFENLAEVKVQVDKDTKEVKKYFERGI